LKGKLDMQSLTLKAAAIKGRTPAPRSPELADSFAPALARTATADPIFRQRWRKIWALGPRISGEAFAESADIVNAPAKVNARLDAYSKIDPQSVKALNCGDWPTELAPVPTQRVT
jgi:hypothetical protein